MSDKTLKPDPGMYPHTTILHHTNSEQSFLSGEATSSGNQVSTTIDISGGLVAALSAMGLLKTREEFFENLIITRAPQAVRAINPPTPSSSSKQIAKYRKRVVNHRDTKHRFVFQEWPRDPNGKVITPENSCPGKMAQNFVQIWGATLFDLYSVRRIPNVPNLSTYSSGSKLARWMKEHGETYSQAWIDEQAKEEDPHEVLPYEIGKLIKESEKMIGGEGAFLNKTWNENDPTKRFVLPESWPPSTPFSASAYPAPWPIPPFTRQHITRIPILQQYISQSLLPAKLIVHDPFNLLSAKTRNDYNEREEYNEEFKASQNIEWSAKEDITHTYILQHSEKNTIRRGHDDGQRNLQEQNRREIREKFLAHPHSRNTLPEGFEFYEDVNQGPGPVKPPIFVVLPFWPKEGQIEEAHLYIAPVSRIGEGNHSFVYKAEMEVPRNTLVEPEICNQCVIDDMMEMILEQDGKNGERRDPKWDEKSGKYILKKTDSRPEIAELPDPITGEKVKYLVAPGQYEKKLVYEGPYRIIESRVKDQSLNLKGPYCKHLRETDAAIHPLTSKVYVAVKLSKQGDQHLAAEAENYQKFPKHFFEHWNGYNILNPMHDPVPLGAVVPQFYGCYAVGPSEQVAKTLENMAVEENVTADKERSGKQTGSDDSDSDTESGSTTQDAPYFSPILLVEDCGEPIEPEMLSADDKAEAGSLIYRFHYEGWLHGSVAKRNILRQPGPLSPPPSERAKNVTARGGLGKDWSFRLIDFGRSTLATPDEILLTSDQIFEGSKVTGWIGGWGGKRSL